MQKSDWTVVTSWIKPIIFAIIFAFLVRTFLFSPVTVDGASMEPTLHDREKIIVSKTVSWIGEAGRGSIVIIEGDEVFYVKRVIGLPGDTIEVKDDQLYINGKNVKEPYLEENRKVAERLDIPLTEDFGPITVPTDHYFVMGDNRGRSIDSRENAVFSLGFIERDRIIGTSKLVIAPFKNIRKTE